MDDQGRRVLAVLSAIAGAVVIAAIVVIYTASGHRNGPSSSSSAADLAGRAPFSGTPAATWKPATTALTMPKATGAGPYSATQVAAALARTRAYLLAAHTDVAVLDQHDLSGLLPYVTKGTPVTLQHLFAIELASGNTLAAPPRLTGSVQMVFVPQTGSTAAHLEVNTNLLWGYALRAGYPVYAASDGVVTVHENMKLTVFLDPVGTAVTTTMTIDPTRDQSLLVNGDCAYFDAGLVGLPRLHDPKRTTGSTDAAGKQFDLHTSVGTGGIGCAK